MYQTAPACFSSLDGTTAISCRFAEPDRYRALFDSEVHEPIIARGAGLSYVAASMGERTSSISMRHFNRLLDFNTETGAITAEAGATLATVLRFLLPRGLILPVMPGHPALTIGGCIAANAHGKNPARDGTFRDHVAWLELWHPRLGLRRFAAGTPEFEATCGGFGLTGIIVAACLLPRRIEGRKARLTVTPVADFNEAHAILRERAESADLVYSWHNWSNPPAARGYVVETTVLPGNDEKLLAGTKPLVPGRGFPLMNRATIPFFNALYGFKARRQHDRIVPLTDTLFPIANMGFYFRLFGNGLLEHQVLVPHERWPRYWQSLANLLHQHHVRPVVSSLKLFSGACRGIDFTGDGVSLTINVVNEPRSHALFAQIDRLDCDNGALANAMKDSRLGAEMFRRQAAGYDRFASQRALLDPGRLFQSALSMRLGL